MSVEDGKGVQNPLGRGTGRGESTTTEGIRKEFEQTFEGKFRESKAQSREVAPGADAMLVFASYFLNYPYPEFHEAFELDDSGYLVPTANEADISILAWTDASGPNYACTAEDVRRAAAKFQETYPQVFFDFHEDRNRRKFSYTATIGQPQK